MAKKKNIKNVKTAKDNEVLKEIKKFYDFMTENKLDLLEFSDGNKTLKLARKSTAAQVQPIPIFSPSTVSSTASPAPQATQTAQPAIPQGETIKSPMSGIFYRAPSPSSPPYVREGDTVKAGQVICIVEAMKVFNEIKAEFDCIIKKVLVENGKPLAANQDIFLIERK